MAGYDGSIRIDTKVDSDTAEAGLSKLRSGLQGFAMAAGAAFLAAGAAVGMLVKTSLASYAQYEQLTGGIETLFKDSAGVVQEYADNAYKTAGLSANAYMETVTSFSASLLQSLDGDTAAATKAADGAVTDMADNANKMGTSMESIQYAYQGFAKQNYTMLDNLKLGYGGTKEEMARLLADAEKLSGQKYDITNLNDVYSAIHVVQTELGITGTTAKEASETISGSVAAMKASWSNLMTGMADDNADFDGLISNFVDSVVTAGNNILPRVEIILNGVGELVSKLAPIIAEKIPGVVENILPSLLTAAAAVVTSLFEGLLAALPTIIPAAVQVIMQLVNTLVENLPLIVSAAVQIILALVQGIAAALPTLIPKMVEVVLSLVQTLISNLPLLISAGMQLLQGLITGLIDSIPLLVSMLPQIIQTIMTVLTENLPQILTMGITLLISLINGIVDALPQLIEMLPEIIVTIVNTLIEHIDELILAGVQILIALIDGLVKAIPQLIATIPKIISAIWDTISKVDWMGLGGNIVKGIWEGMSALASWLWDQVTGMFSGIVEGVKDVLGIHSPSRVFAEIGSFMALGLGKGFTDSMQSVAGDINGAVPTSLDLPSFGSQGSYGWYSVPQLAEGAVLPPNRKFIAQLGDQTNGNNIETPESLLREIINDALSEFNGGGGDIKVTVNFEGSLAQLGRALRPVVLVEDYRVGERLVQVGVSDQ